MPQKQRIVSLVAITLTALSYTKALMFNSRLQFTIKAEENKEFNESFLIGTFRSKDGNIADCLEHCLENCSCQSFQICQNGNNTLCQLCSTNKYKTESLLRDSGSCIYAVYTMQHLAGNLQVLPKIDSRCFDMKCSMKYNCCQQSNLCPKNKLCKPLNSLEQPWKRYICECPDGYYGNNCELRITSCQGYTAEGSPQPGVYKVLDSNNSTYEVYCYFDKYGAWTLVQSYSFANRSLSPFTESLRKDLHVNENALTWSGYRLNKGRMRSIIKSSSDLRFTCGYKKNIDVLESDHLQIRLESIDVLEQDQSHTSIFSSMRHGKIAGRDLEQCDISLYQIEAHAPLCALIKSASASTCMLQAINCYFFGCYKLSSTCLHEGYSCVQNKNSTTQLWFGGK